MHSLTTYKETTLFYDFINKFHDDKSNLRTFNKKFQKLIITTKLTNINEKKIVFSFFMFEIFTIKKTFFNSKFLFTVKDGGYLFVKIVLRSKQMDFFLLKYLWIFFPVLRKNKIKFNFKTLKLKNKALYLKPEYLKHLENCLNFKLHNKIYFNFLLPSNEANFLRKFYKIDFFLYIPKIN